MAFVLIAKNFLTFCRKKSKSASYIKKRIEDLHKNKLQKKKTVKNIVGLIVKEGLLLVVIIALILIFKDKIMELLNDAFGTISEGAEELGV